jgi:predicted double-glycine peptidase
MIKLKIFEQTKSGYCGPAALRTVLWFYGFKKSEKELGRLCKTTAKEGTKPEDLIEAVKLIGWHGFWKEKASISDIKYFLKQGRPVLVDWFSLYGEHYEGHYSSIIGMDKKYIYLADPEIGQTRKILAEAFLKVWFDYDGSNIKNARRLYFGWMLAPAPIKIKAGLKGNYF